jgi:hypothetical protein
MQHKRLLDVASSGIVALLFAVICPHDQNGLF